MELKAEETKEIHGVQILTHMKLANIHQGLLMNYNVPILKKVIKNHLL